jgi:hypothetical protein
MENDMEEEQHTRAEEEREREDAGTLSSSQVFFSFSFLFFGEIEKRLAQPSPAQPSVFVFVCARTDQTRIRYGGISFPVERGGKN